MNLLRSFFKTPGKSPRRLVIKGGTMTSIAGVRTPSIPIGENSVLRDPNSKVGKSRYAR